jgi:hypothetical protein
MKTKLISSIILILFVFNSNAQIKVVSNGMVRIGGGTSDPTASLEVQEYNKTAEARIYAKSANIARIWTLNSVFSYGFGVDASGIGQIYRNINSESSLMSFANSMVNYYAYSGYNYSLTFDLRASDPRIYTNSANNQVNFYNSTSASWVDVQCRTLYQNSDSKNKTNIALLKNGLNTVKQLRGVTYNWKDNNTSNAATQSVESQYGLIAQEVEKVVPNLVLTTDSTQGKTLSYTGVIPILIEAIKDLSVKVDSLETLLTSSKSSLKSASVSSTIESTVIQSASASVNGTATLDQNAPNPFSQSTNIGYYLPETVQAAALNVYDMNGIQIKSISVNSKGKGSVTINGNELRPGMYLYTLIADGQEVSTKRMILTQ